EATMEAVMEEEGMRMRKCRARHRHSGEASRAHVWSYAHWVPNHAHGVHPHCTAHPTSTAHPHSTAHSHPATHAMSPSHPATSTTHATAKSAASTTPGKGR